MDAIKVMEFVEVFVVSATASSSSTSQSGCAIVSRPVCYFGPDLCHVLNTLL